MTKVLTLGLIIEGNKILLGMKKRGFGQGKWNGFGGKVEEDELIDDGLEREVLEETGIHILEYKKKAIITFYIESQPEPLEGHIFVITKFEGTPWETAEMNPQWFKISDIPYSDMWVTDEHWLPIVLAGKTIEATFELLDESTLIGHQIKEVSSLI